MKYLIKIIDNSSMALTFALVLLLAGKLQSLSLAWAFILVLALIIVMFIRFAMISGEPTCKQNMLFNSAVLIMIIVTICSYLFVQNA